MMRTSTPIVSTCSMGDRSSVLPLVAFTSSMARRCSSDRAYQTPLPVRILTCSTCIFVAVKGPSLGKFGILGIHDQQKSPRASQREGFFMHFHFPILS